MIDIYELEMERIELMDAYDCGELTLEEAVAAFRSANAKAIIYKEGLDALRDSVQNNLTEEQMNKVLDGAEKTERDFDHRFNSVEDMKILWEYGYDGMSDVVLIREFSDAKKYIDKDFQVYILMKTKTKAAKDSMEIEKHLENGGYCVVDYYAAEEMASELYGDSDDE